MRTIISLFLAAFFLSSRRNLNATSTKASVHLLNKDNYSFPRVTDPEFRLACDEVAERLAKKRGFKFQVICATAAILLSGVVLVVGIAGVGLYEFAKISIAASEKKLGEQLGEYTKLYQDKIAEEFKAENVQKAVLKAAQDQAGILLKDAVQPKIANFDEFLHTNQQKAESELTSFRNELGKLEFRNSLTALADNAIGNRDYSAFLKLREASYPQSGFYDPQTNLVNPAIMAELHRIYSAYSVFSAHWVLPNLKVEVINPNKKLEAELTVDELAPLFARANDGLARAKIALLLGRFKQSKLAADAIIGALKNETDMEAARQMDEAFEKITGFQSQDSSLLREPKIKWWDENKADFPKPKTN